MSAGWTDEQRAAIEAEGNDLLVSAGAGAGKTAVLVERIIRRILDPSREIDVDRLLVVTFTEAAAAEMRQRIAAALLTRVATGADRRAERQLMLLGRASITTVHGFCYRMLRQYSYRLDLDPAFRVLDAHEADLLQLDVLEELFESRYASDPPAGPFYDLVGRYGGERGDAGVREAVLALHQYVTSLPDPDRWLDAAVDRFSIRRGAAPWYAELVAAAAATLRHAAALTRTAERLAKRPDGPVGYVSALAAAAAVFEELAELADGVARTGAEDRWDAWRSRLSVLGELPVLPRISRRAAVDPFLKEAAQAAYGRARDLVRPLCEGVFARSAAEHGRELAQLAGLMASWVDLTRAFDRRYRAAKLQRRAIDYADMERLCLRLLAASDEAERSVASELQSRYEEIYVDEYQDINPLQDALLQRLARPGRLFLVGDVKQSIYAFRLAEPALFLARYASASSSPQPDQARRIDLSANFRSAPGVVDGVNFLFRQWLTPAAFGMAYDPAAELVARAPYPPARTADGEADACLEVHLIERGFDTDDGEDSTEGSEGLGKLEVQAALIGRRIREMVAE
ncbi:MAG TPA: UvrD-helicase domain-containing protein, partial [Limnochordia bacterium]